MKQSSNRFAMEERIWVLLAGKFSGNLTAEQESELKKLLDSSPQNQKRYEEAKKAWGKAEFDTSLFSLSRGKEKLRRVSYEKEAPVIPIPSASTFPLFWRGFAAAVAILLLAFGAYQFNSSEHEKVAFLEKHTLPGQKMTITLADGSKVKVNAASELKYPERFSDSTRVVYLKGEAFFEVEHDPARPFTVVTDSVSTTVLGTSFNISAYPEDGKLSISVATGKVKVEKAGWETPLLTAGEQVEVGETSTSFVVTNFDIEEVLSWKDSTLVFKNTPLNEVAKKLERWFGVEVIFLNQAIKNCQITGNFKNETLVNILESIAYTSELKYELAGKRVTLSGKGCAE